MQTSFNRLIVSLGAIAAIPILVAHVAFALDEPPITLPEKAKISEAAASIEQQCHVAIAGVAKQLAAEASKSPVPALASIISTDSYCGCIADRFRTELTPAMTRSGTKEDGAALIKSIANRCAVAEFKAGWPKLCRALADIKPPTKASANVPQQVEEVCECVKPNVDMITGDMLNETWRQTMIDYAAYRRSSAARFTGGPLSLLTPMRDCIRDNIDTQRNR